MKIVVICAKIDEKRGVKANIQAELPQTIYIIRNTMNNGLFGFESGDGVTVFVDGEIVFRLAC